MEIDRICEESELGKISFQFVRKFCGNSVVDGKIQSISSKNKFVFCFDDGYIHTYSIKAITTIMATNFPELMSMGKLGSRTSANVGESEAELRESDSEEETLEILSKKKAEWSNEQSDSESES